MTRYQRLAVTCGALPLLAGAAIFMTWFFTRWAWLMIAGIFTIGLGTLAFAIGWTGLVLDARAEAAGKIPARSRAKTRGAKILLLANFPMAVLFAIAAAYLDSRYLVTLHNDSAETLTAARVEGGGATREFGDLAPGKSTWCLFSPEGDGALLFIGTRGSVGYNSTVEGYITRGMGGRIRIMIEADGELRASTN